MKKLMKITFVVFIMVLTMTSIFIKADEGKIILIDPGHGGIDGGAKSKVGTLEKDINLQVSLKLKDSLESKGYKVFLTRETDESLHGNGKTVREKKREDLKRRTELKKETKCAAFISIHQNMFPQANCYGAQVWYSNNEKSSLLAEKIQASLKENVNDNNKRVAKAAGESYLILRDGYEGASVLVECGFLSNPEEEKRLKSDEHQNLIVEGITLGLEKYFSEEN